MTEPQHTAPRETARLLIAAYAENKEHELVRKIYGPYLDAIRAAQLLADELWRQGEVRWSAAAGTRVQDLETQARRHIEAIAERARATTDPVPVVPPAEPHSLHMHTMAGDGERIRCNSCGRFGSSPLRHEITCKDPRDTEIVP